MANTIVKGKIARVSAKPGFKNRAGEDVVLHSFQLEGKNTWYRTGENPIPAGVGQSVQFVADDVKVDVTTFEVVQGAVVTAPSASQVATAQTSAAPTTRATAATPGCANPYTPSMGANGYTGNKYDDRDLYWARKEAKDDAKDARFQAINEPRMALSVATEAAAAIVCTAIEKDALSFGNAAKAKKLGLMVDYTKEVALALAAFIADAPNQLQSYKTGGGSVVPTEEAAPVTAEVQE